MTVACPTLPYLRQDSRLPERDWLLDDAATAELLSSTLSIAGPLTLERVERRRVKYRIGESLRSVHRVWSSDRSWLVSARMRAAGAAAQYAEAQPHARPCGPLHGVAYAAAVRTVFWTFPNDRCLGDASVLHAGLPAIRDAFPSTPLAVDIVGYNPERAVIARLSDPAGTPRGYAKLFANKGQVSARDILTWLWLTIARTGSPLRVPSVRGEDAVRGILVVDAVAGTHLETLAVPDLDGAFGCLGTALGHLHSLPLPESGLTLPPWTSFDDSALSLAADTIGWARPDLGDVVHDTAARLSRCRPAPGPAVVLHGDMNSRNWLVTPQDVGLIDFDQAAAGPASGDLAGVLGWLRTRTLTGAWPAAQEAALTGAFLNGYAAVRPLPTVRELAWHRASALLVERALRAVTRVRPDTLRCLDALVADASREAREATRV